MTTLHQFLVGVMAPERFMTFFDTVADQMPQVAESFANEFWGELDHPPTMTVLVIDTETGCHETFKVDCAGYRFDAFAPAARDVVRELEMWAVYHQKHLLDTAELFNVQMLKRDLAYHIGRKIQSVRDPKSVGVPRDLLDEIKLLVSELQDSPHFCELHGQFFTFVKFQLDQPIPETWKRDVVP
ncbi:hypothetical protein [Deinococcus cellulosilyticus]|uniref:Uncharacterized protein n=1 Tax=Deinococcus cellulosilyticus (strain DSM 18568 / NBRC 106333 / KACC 11606 / 5516J-15) TaxID=1223518 RepID=A0A511N8F6_DEIC1|nr:hypothetical protein [Deinococcus cellulosilyticus]GEM48807.1 hypothetical protein DC3_44420 [Deinococcus cellulosilyticus NBRC 106333 = KACC 11606]